MTVAYFCAEYAVDADLSIYAGGLGILAGDYLREASDQNTPLVAIGLMYHDNNPITLPVVKDSLGNPLRVAMPLQDKKIFAQVYQKMVGSIPLYLLSTNVEENEVVDRQITAKLYIIDKEVRLKQEMVLGIGGFRLLEALDIEPTHYHINEGHAALLGLEVIHHEMETTKIDWTTAIIQAQQKIVFTNHTLVPAGHDMYASELTALLLSGYAREIGIPMTGILELGQVIDSSLFSMTILALRIAGRSNAVSQLHAEVAKRIWPQLPMLTITNGIHLSTWDQVKNLQNHDASKEKLLAYITKTTGIVWPEEHLLIGWARRFVEYKRPLAVLEQVERFLALAKDSLYPVHLVFAGKPHESDEQGKELLQKLLTGIEGKLAGSVVYLPNYNKELAQLLVAGCDVWLNTPIVGYEACGTSGMKAALNGVLPCTTADGWVAEANVSACGWLLDDANITDSILTTLEQKIIPLYYHNQLKWQLMMASARTMIMNQFSTTRMLKEYQEKLYNPKN